MPGTLLVNKIGAATGTEISFETGHSMAFTTAQFKLTGGTVGQAITTDGSGNLTFADMTSDPTMGGDLTGTASNAQIAANAVGTAEIATDAVTANEIVAGAVGSSEIATDAVTSNEIATDAVTSNEIATDAVTTGKINSDVVTNREIAAGAVGATEIAATIDLSSKTVTLPAASVTAHVTQTDTSVLEDNIALLAFKLASSNSLAQFQMVDQVIDEFVDATGIDTGSSVGETLSSGYYQGGGGDPSTKFLMHPSDNGTSTVFTSDDNTGHTCTGGSNVELSTGHVAVGTHSVVFSGTMPNTLTVPNHADFDLGSGDFTIEYWLRYHSMTPGGGSTNVMIARGTTTGYANYDWYVGNYTGNKLMFRTSDGSTPTTYTSDTVSISANTWYHWCVERYNDVIYFYQNGTGVGTVAISGAIPNAGHTFTMGGDMDWDENLVGYLDELRISSVARYEGTNFTAPATDFTAGSPVVDMTLISTTTTAEATPTTGDIVMLIEDAYGTATVNTDVIAYISRDAGSNWSSAVTLVDEGNWGTNKRILVARDVNISSLAGTTSMRWKVTTHNQSTASKETRIHAVSLAWA